MLSRSAAKCLRRSNAISLRSCTCSFTTRTPSSPSLLAAIPAASRCRLSPRSSAFHTSSRCSAQSPTADALMENLTDLYSTAKDEFEIAAEETEKKTVYAADDREAAQEALQMLKEAFERAVKESDPEVGKEIQSRVGQRIRELENAVKVLEEMAMED
ncbi:hypothetical protein EDD37DRAFT_123461 [Exophiala viscosa]|uniref:Uncharacterized protein n=1 Tax=Exophiala viscosa TaxID=2486360 RepID=A0AAN6DYD1_9EURO|nr:hypothetical protein EDD36DRAFT_223171 [Exophiala viscosa]KAI1621577.1 hypothetical protein EDD37DRAFT_123461 [Exophiala viscosa]